MNASATTRSNPSRSRTNARIGVEGGDGGAPRSGAQQSDLAEIRAGPQGSDVGLRSPRRSPGPSGSRRSGRTLALRHERYPRRKRLPPPVLQQLGEARGPQACERWKLAQLGQCLHRRARTRARGSSRPAVGRTSPCRSRRPPLIDGPNGRRPARRRQQPHLAERLAAFEQCAGPARHRCPDPPPRRRTARAHDVEGRRPVALTEDRLARPDAPERDPAGEVVQRLDRQVVERRQCVDRARRPRRATSIRHGTRARERSHGPDGRAARTSWITPRMAGPARNTTSSTRSRILEPKPPFHSDDDQATEDPLPEEVGRVEGEDREDDPEHGVEPEADLLLGQPLTRPQLVPQVVLDELQATAGAGPAPGSGR